MAVVSRASLRKNTASTSEEGENIARTRFKHGGLDNALAGFLRYIGEEKRNIFASGKAAEV